MCLSCASESDQYSGENCQFSDLINCNSNGKVDGTNGACSCSTGYAGSSCQFSDVENCNGRGSVSDAGTCSSCNAGYAGPKCEFSDAVTCNGYGHALHSGACACTSGFDPALNCRTCSLNVVDSRSGACSACKLEYLSETFPGCNIPACGPSSDGQENDDVGTCRCFPGWTGSRCECYVGLSTGEDAACIQCADDPDFVYEYQMNGKCTFTTSTTETTTTETTTTETTTTTPIICSGRGRPHPSDSSKCICDDNVAGQFCQYTSTTECDDHGILGPAVPSSASASSSSSQAFFCKGCLAGYDGGVVKQVDNIFVRDSCSVCNPPHQNVTTRSGSFWCLDFDSEVRSCPAGRYFQITTNRSASNSSVADGGVVDGACAPCESGSYAVGPGKRLECTACGFLPGSTKRQTSIVGSTSIDDCFVEKMYAEGGTSYCTGFGTDDRQSGLTELSRQECKQFAEEFRDEGLVYSDEPPCQDEAGKCSGENDDNNYIRGIGCNNQFESIDTVTNVTTIIVVNDICPFTCGACKSLSNSTSYVDAAPTGCVVVATETSATIVRYYSPNQTPTVDDPIVESMYTGEQFRPACKAHICELNTTTSDAVLYVSQGDASRDASTLEFAIPTCGPNVRQINMWLASETSASNQIFIPTAVGITAISMVGAYFYIGDVPHRFQFVVFAVGLRLFDVVTDWGNYVVNIRGKLFAFAYGDQDPDTADANVQSMIWFTLAICILSTMLTPFDIWGASQRVTDGLQRSWLIIVVLLIEDVPQLGITINYMNQVYSAVISNDYYTANDYIKKDIIAIISLAASVGNLLYSIYLLTCGKQHAPVTGLGQTPRFYNNSAFSSGNNEYPSPLEHVNIRGAAQKKGGGLARSTRFSASDVGKPCIVVGVGSGTIRFVGLHAEKNDARIGVEMNKPKGKNNGTVNGHKYFECPDGFGLLTIPSHVKHNTGSRKGSAKVTSHGTDEYLDVGGAAAAGSHA